MAGAETAPPGALSAAPVASQGVGRIPSIARSPAKAVTMNSAKILGPNMPHDSQCGHFRDKVRTGQGV